MPRPKYKDRYASYYFDTKEEKLFWEKFAKERGTSLSNLIPEALAALRDRDSSLPRPDLLKENELMKEELRKASRELKLKDSLIQKYESELYKTQQSEFQEVTPEGEVSRRYDLSLVKLLKSGKTYDSQAILTNLGIDPNDGKIVRLIWNQLEALQKYELVHETQFGWKWS
jgi:hypothetical protein